MRDLHDIASDQLNRVLGFFERIDSKIAALFATDAALLAITSLNVHLEDIPVVCIAICLGLTVALLALSLVQLYIAYSPHLKSASPSLIYFQDIGLLNEKDFVSKFRAQNEAERLDDCLSQIWRNSEILTIKYQKLKSAFLLTACSLIPWTLFLAQVSSKYSKMPILLN